MKKAHVLSLLAAFAFLPSLAALAEEQAGESALEKAAAAIAAAASNESASTGTAFVAEEETLEKPEAKEKKKDHVNPKNYDDLEGEEGLYWGGWDGSIMGRVIDKQGAPLPFAKVKVHSKELETLADKDGNFRIDGVQVGGHYSLIISARGKEPGVARWIPIPVMKVARIGDFSVEPEKVWTNFWIVATNTTVLAEYDALSNKTERVVANCLSNYYDIVESETNIYSYSEWYFKFHLTYTERMVLQSLGITNVPLAKLELARRSIGFGSDGRPLAAKEEESLTNIVEEAEIREPEAKETTKDEAPSAPQSPASDKEEAERP